ncbi:MAG: AbrB/MazE/SpoVT family DNA-binding domain-containing protein [Gammaproteobacteria bacterium]|nr:AbrB/MazE/SpoVT family DNA-binding domain-containing protein [Gammaproteobacteria bacterium]
MPNQTAKLFNNGRSQAVRLPAEFRFEGAEVYIHKEGEQVILSAISTVFSLIPLLAKMRAYWPKQPFGLTVRNGATLRALPRA